MNLNKVCRQVSKKNEEGSFSDTTYFCPEQNRRQKVLNRGALRLCVGVTFVQGGLTSKFDKNSTNL